MTLPLILGLTGSIGMGKSAVAAMFEAHGVPVFDADAEVRAMQGPGGPVLGAIEAVHSLRASGFEPERSIEVIVFAGTESVRFGPGTS